jgi:nucleotide-binding universal stress UspA family protein
MYTLLVPFDNSPSARRALEYALGHAAARGDATLHVLTVLDDVGTETRELVNAAEIDRVLSGEAAAQQQAAREIADPTGLPCVYHAEPGHPAQLIADYAKNHAIDHIVMGTRGLSKIAGLLMGSVANRVVHEATCPVTLVK